MGGAVTMEQGSNEAAESSSESLLVSDALSSKKAERERLEAEIAAFLADGGQINQIEANVVADPPKKPQSNYGGQPI